MIGAVFFVIGMLCNVGSAFIYLAFYSTAALRKAVGKKLGLTAFAFTASAIHPEAVRVVADRGARSGWRRARVALGW